MTKKQTDLPLNIDIQSIDWNCLKIKDVYNSDGTVKDTICLCADENNDTTNIKYSVNPETKQVLMDYMMFLQSQNIKLNPDGFLFKSSDEEKTVNTNPTFVVLNCLGWITGMCILGALVCFSSLMLSINNLHLEGKIITLLVVEFFLWFFLLIQGVRQKNNFMLMIVLTFVVIFLNTIIIGR